MNKWFSLLRLSVLFVVLMFSAVVGAVADSLRAAASEAKLSPPPGLEMYGYSAREGTATGVLDPLFARVLVLDDGETRVGIVTLDLGRLFGVSYLDAVRKQVRDKAEIDEVFFIASHTHGGPNLWETYTDREQPEWERMALREIVGLLVECGQNLQPARIGVGYGQTYIGHNRRYIEADGRVKMLWRNETKIPTSPVDPTVGVIRIDNLAGKPLAILVNYSCHPVVLGPDNLQYTADYPGSMVRTVLENSGEETVCLFLQGAAGDINPYYDKTPLQENGVRLMRETGVTLGREVIRVLDSIETSQTSEASIAYSLETFEFECRWERAKVLPLLKNSGLSPASVERYSKYLESPVECPVMTLLINNEIALMGMPGEPFVEFAMDFRGRCPVQNPFFVGYANGTANYFPTIRAAAEGGYGADTFGTRVEVGAGERIVDHSIVKLNEMLETLTGTPSM